ncbi:DUF2110 family protein [Natronobacterium gregoryi]|uniref:DUF2110 domain-containing protein n=2 Tax=Natronobacterium gregoryi TaxID=44930 RepID=L0ACZ9_NATGS|nr:DUF2110 family protein [Natronobacterium gregoryi]AFZ71773.1 hypothetical protein Natgr_0520 [Natronobacterium gregoryi SP2]ELY72842.1 hypothetical protein C490_02436 [Natronobacterium gregoryi SP2]PLK21046.1 DUF2110 domain-containing protein [Natronobacterium gregoryi SP2]SFI88159.1 hypothetical protein SAMN05443661_10850 [Natronobacterium gregoryi]
MVVLATKLYVEGDARERSLDSLRSLVDNEIGELAVEYELGVRHDDFPSVTIEGDDATVARNVLREEFGEIVPDLEDGETYVGTLDSWDEDGIVLDAGQPVRIPTDELGLGPGAPSQLRERYGLVQHMPLQFVYADDGDSRLSDEERDRLYDWTRGDGRLNVNSATRAEVRATLNRAGHAQDYVTVERLGLLEQSVVCTEDTDPPGLLASVGEYLPAELRCVVP